MLRFHPSIRCQVEVRVPVFGLVSSMKTSSYALVTFFPGAFTMLLSHIRFSNRDVILKFAGVETLHFELE